MLAGALLLTQLGAMIGITAWLFTGMRDNLLYPGQNEAFTAEVLEMRRLKTEYPDAYTPVAHRAITDRRAQLRLFRLIVLGEGIAFLVLVCGCGALGLACLGLVALDTARALALLGAGAFTAVWAGMLIAGNHFCYWFGHEGAQNTHYQMCLWGLAVTILLAQG